MSTQGQLFPGIQAALRSPVAASADPETSHLAAKEITESGTREIQLHKVLELVRKYPLCTSMELSVRGKMDRYVTARRLPELAAGHLVSRRTARTCTVSGKKAVTWEAM